MDWAIFKTPALEAPAASYIQNRLASPRMAPATAGTMISAADANRGG
jgi:hypothetical protein